MNRAVIREYPAKREHLTAILDDIFDFGRIAGQKLLSEKSGFFRYLKDGKAYRVFFCPIPSTGWVIGLVFPEDEPFVPLHHLVRTSMITAFLGTLFIVLIVSIIPRKSTARIMKLSEIAQTISTGNLNAEIPADTSGDELGTLASTLDYMQKSLRQYIEDLKTATAKKERLKEN